MSRHHIALIALIFAGALTTAPYHTNAATKYTLTSDSDTTVYSRYPQENFGREPYVFLTSVAPPSSSIPAKLLLHFNLSSIRLNPGDRVDSAQLKLTQVLQRGWGSTPIRARRLEDAFTETQTVWDHPTAPYFDASSYNVFSEQSPRVTVDGLRFFGRTVTLDVKDIVRRWLEDSAPNNGFLIEADVPNPCYCGYGVVFFSRESRDTGAPDLQDLTPRQLGTKPTLTIGINPGSSKR